MKVGWDAIRRTDNAGRVPLFIMVYLPAPVITVIAPQPRAASRRKESGAPGLL